jgi:glycosyltransferase involved in cell wall biosynthesis
MKLNVISDLNGLDRISYRDLEIKQLKYTKEGNKLIRILKYFFISFYYDYFILDFSKEIFIFGLMKLCFPFNTCRFVTHDIFLPNPSKSIKDQIKKYIKVLALKSIDLIFLYSKRNERLSEAYHINPEKLIYVPFKINSYDYVISHKTSDRGYILSGGVSRRDYQTLIEAAKHFPYPVKIVVPHEKQAEIHGTFINIENIPSNVEIIHDDGSIESFVSYIANSRLVVLPLKADDFASTGTSVYLVSMALKKCVIISSGPTTDDILTQKTAIIVPPEDPESLRRAIKRAFNDDAYRKQIADNGYKYAISLGDEKRLFHSIIKEVYADYSPTGKK